MGFLDRDAWCRNQIPDEDSQKAEKERTVRQVGPILILIQPAHLNGSDWVVMTKFEDPVVQVPDQSLLTQATFIDRQDVMLRMRMDDPWLRSRGRAGGEPVPVYPASPAANTSASKMWVYRRLFVSKHNELQTKWVSKKNPHKIYKTIS